MIHCCLVLDFIVTFEAVLLFCPKTLERCWPAQDDPVVDVAPCLVCFLFFVFGLKHITCRLTGPAYFSPPLPYGIIANSNNGNPEHLVYQHHLSPAQLFRMDSAESVKVLRDRTLQKVP